MEVIIGGRAVGGFAILAAARTVIYSNDTKMVHAQTCTYVYLPVPCAYVMVVHEPRARQSALLHAAPLVH